MSRNVLIIDDDPWIAMSTAMVLEAESLNVRSAASGPEGLASVKREPPGVVLLDIMMPGMDGWETLERLKRDPASALVPVLVFTAHEQSDGAAKAKELGASGYFRKPFRPDALVGAVKKELGLPASDR